MYDLTDGQSVNSFGSIKRISTQWKDISDEELFEEG